MSLNKIYGSFIFFFYFVKYPVVIYLALAYLYLDMAHNIFMDILGVISVILILKDWFFPHEKPNNCSGIKK